MAISKIKVRHVAIVFVAVLFLSQFLADKLNSLDFTLEDYYSIEKGMSYEEVVNTLGGEGEEVLSDRSDPNNETYSYKWLSSHGGTIRASFVNGKLANKNEFELKKESELDR